jgi:hypothetical protein
MMDDDERRYLLALKDSISAKQESWRRLSPRERNLLDQRTGLRDGTLRSISETAALWGMTEARIKQIEAKAIRKLSDPRNPGPPGAAAGVPRRPRFPADGTAAKIREPEPGEDD